MAVIQDNCSRCLEYKNSTCDGAVNDCMCKNCPRNLAECLITKYCRETESVIYADDGYDY
ncbi:hypothetical protein [Clostridium botulinum]|uniref:Alpha/beta hydrolase n=1 Tax=Clostridium botulinum TaxID=1491 RepID=A0A9Q1ZB50_CLOBO|nr:hypothetical protein [Clostridium botulinum]AEB77174.1 conserved hypothetical protein [Clostridium botulinum BKT015925]KEH98098.1 alpha/beta hydrolase [Clostridium botulinum D str. 16868]KEH99680.1 alpha/beta hydrolase [Clostridium botulinum C/D str. Sp77]KLU76809.1 alpha/beta hydrolase [Clostridium botulinum V891]KOA72608.1 alpha/beta hydrolase [Clostridium botulinum]